MSFDRLIWLVVDSAYFLVAAGAVAIRLQLASGFGFDFLGLWRPPNSEDFRRMCGVAALSALTLAALFVLFVALRGRGVPRIAVAICPAFAFLLFWLMLVA